LGIPQDSRSARSGSSARTRRAASHEAIAATAASSAATDAKVNGSVAVTPNKM
jgi:hypothetical protein